MPRRGLERGSRIIDGQKLNTYVYFYHAMKKLSKRQKVIRELDTIIRVAGQLKELSGSDTNWIRKVRTTLGIRLNQLTFGSGMTIQGWRQLENREMDESISLRSLRQAARNLKMDLVYAFVPWKGSLEKLVEDKARELAFSKEEGSLLEAELRRNERPEIFERLVRNIIEDYPKELWDQF